MALLGEVMVLAVGLVIAILGLLRDWPKWIVILLALVALSSLAMLVMGRRRERGKSTAPSTTFRRYVGNH